MKRLGFAQRFYTFIWITDARSTVSSQTTEKIKVACGISKGPGIACLGGLDVSSQGKRTGRNTGESRANYGQISIDAPSVLFHNVMLLSFLFG